MTYYAVSGVYNNNWIKDFLRQEIHQVLLSQRKEIEGELQEILDMIQCKDAIQK